LESKTEKHESREREKKGKKVGGKINKLYRGTPRKKRGEKKAP